MTFFFLTEQHFMTLENLPDGRYYTKYLVDQFVYQVPHGCAPVWCSYSGDWHDHSWTNTFTNQVFENNNPLGLTTKDTSFYEGFYEITTIDGLTFREGEAWCLDTNEKIHVDKIDPKSIWNPFFQRYDPACSNCSSGKAIKEMSSSSDFGSYLYLDMFIQCQELFFDVYCNCGLHNGYHHHTDSDSD